MRTVRAWPRLCASLTMVAGSIGFEARCSSPADAVISPTGPDPLKVNWSLAHRPSTPTALTPLSISAEASDTSADFNIEIELDDAVVKACLGGSCTYSARLPEGSYKYSAFAIPSAGNRILIGAGGFVVEPPLQLAPERFSVSPTSPHWRHMRTSTIDYRIHYEKGNEQLAEYDFAARTYDLIVGGSVGQYKQRNGTILQFAYDLLWSEQQAGATAMESWLQANGFDPEAAYLHTAGSTRSSENRIAVTLWNSARWVTNPADSGFKAWRQYASAALTSTNGGPAFDGIMFDEFNVTTIRRNVPASTLEYTSFDSYLSDLRALLRAHRGWVPAGFNMLNSSQYFNREEDRENAIAAGGVLTEFVNSPFAEQKWDDIDYMLDNGAVVEFGTGVSASTKDQKREDISSGNYNTIAERVLMWEYASYLMVVRPERMDALYFETYGLTWSVPHSTTWLKAFEYDIGPATEARSRYLSGTDPEGQRYSVMMRRFENGIVLIRARNGTKYGDTSAVTVNLPDGEWRMLLADGNVTGPMTSVNLRNSEALILVR